MKALFVTMQRVSNYGSVLQTLALQNALLENGFDEVRVLDYYPERQTPLGAMKRIANKVKAPLPIIWCCQIVMIPSYIKRAKIFNRFRKDNLYMTQCYHNPNEIHEVGYDVYLTGSDQVWNYKESEGVDPIYYLEFSNSKNKLAYAASFGLDSIEGVYKKEIKQYLKNYKWIGVRERSGVNLLNKIGVNNVDEVVDPVLLYDRSFYEKLIDEEVKYKNYVLIYNLHRSKKMDLWVKKFAEYNQLKVIYIGYSYHEMLKKGKYLCVPSVSQYLSAIKNASCVVSDSFHATVFAVLFNRPFFSMLPEKYGVRIRDLLTELELDNQIINFDKTAEVDIPSISYNDVAEKLNKKRTYSRQILSKKLGEIKNDKNSSCGSQYECGRD